MVGALDIVVLDKTAPLSTQVYEWVMVPEFTKPRRRRRGQRRLKNKFHTFYEFRDTRKSFTLFITVKTISKLNAKHSDKYEIKILKFSHRGSRSPDSAELGHFTLLF